MFRSDSNRSLYTGNSVYGNKLFEPVNCSEMKKQMRSEACPPKPLIGSDEVHEIDYEICWCTEKLENMLSRNLSDRERKQCELSLKILRNPQAALIRKRQVMRQQFGDYKKIIASDKKNIKNDINIQFKDVTVPAKSVFIRTKKIVQNEGAMCSNGGSESTDLKVNIAQDQKNISGISLSDNSFRFNF